LNWNVGVARKKIPPASPATTRWNSFSDEIRTRDRAAGVMPSMETAFDHFCD